MNNYLLNLEQKKSNDNEKVKYKRRAPALHFRRSKCD